MKEEIKDLFKEIIELDAAFATFFLDYSNYTKLGLVVFYPIKLIIGSLCCLVVIPVTFILAFVVTIVFLILPRLYDWFMSLIFIKND